MKKWFETDDLQWCNILGDSKYDFLCVREIDSNTNPFWLFKYKIDMDFVDEDERKSACNSFGIGMDYDEVLEKEDSERIIAELIAELNCFQEGKLIDKFETEEKLIKFVEREYL